MRIESPSSINTFKNCKRKYYYAYIEGLPLKENLFTIKGKIVHSTLENFFNLDIDEISDEDYEFELKAVIVDLLKQNWFDRLEDVHKLNINDQQLNYHFEETRSMLLDWVTNIIDKLGKENFKDSFKKFKPRTEVKISSDALGVRGIIDAIHEFNNQVILIDYKTSTNEEAIEDHKLQLAIYVLLYHEQYGKLPDMVGINYLKFGERFIKLNEDFLNQTKEEIKILHLNTISNKIGDYAQNPSKLCKWSDGECDFFNICKPFDK